MKHLKKLNLTLLFCSILMIPMWAQTDQELSQVRGMSQKICDKAADQSLSVSNSIIKQSKKLQSRLCKYEKHLAACLDESDSVSRRVLQRFRETSADSYEKMLALPDSLLAGYTKGPYLQRLDSLKSMIDFIGKDNMNGAGKLTEAEAAASRVGIAKNWEQQLQERQQIWKQLFERNNKLLPDAYRKMQANVLAYNESMKQWQETLNSPGKLEEQALKILNRIPAFKEFMQQNGELAKLLGNGNGVNANTAGAALGVLTPQALSTQIQNRFGSNTQVLNIVQQQIQQGIGQINQLQNPVEQISRFRQYAGQIPGRTLPSTGSLGNTKLTANQKEQAEFQSQSFAKKLDFGWNLQNRSKSGSMPATNDFGLSLGYKVSPKCVLGIGMAYKFGLGTWQKIDLTHEGIGMRSFLDWRVTAPNSAILSNIWVTGSFEMNYWERISQFRNLEVLPWQKSALLGITKKIPNKGRTIKSQILIDLYQLSSGIPSQYLLFRIGTSF